jgi:hypothetical protein
MAQKTNLNVSPYYDDFNSEKNYYKVLFNPGRPVQARELTTFQSILQNQIESFGSHMFKEGSMVIPGNIGYDGQYYSVKLNPTNFGIDVSVYINYFVGKKITGQSSGTTAIIQYVALPDGNNVTDLTIYVKYLDSDNNFKFNAFEDGESLSADENIIYGNTTINAGTPFASLVSLNATSIGSAVSIAKGVYFVRGYFANVESDTLILDNYTNTPSYRVGLKIDELVITSKDDKTLYDNAKGFTNYAAPGADRFKINLTLTKKLLTDTNDTDFIELLRVRDGKIKKIETQTQYSLIKDYFAQRTYDESGDYSVNPFIPSVHNSLNDRLGNNGIFFSNEKTDQGNTPSDDLMCIKISPGKCYVKGYDVTTTGTTILDVDKPRDKETISGANVPFEMGNLLRVNNVSGTPKFNAPIELYDLRKNSTSSSNGTKIGDARVYTLNLTDAAYSNASTKWDLYLYDIQTYTKITLNSSVSSSEVKKTSFIKGKSSGASGYATADGSGVVEVYLRQTSGSFSVGEQIELDGVNFPRTIKSVQTYSTDDIKSIYQSTATSGYTIAFIADSYLEKFALPNGVISVNIDGSTGNTTANGSIFTGIKVGSIIRYQESGSGITSETFNRVTSISPDGLSITLGTVIGVSNVCEGTLPSTGQYNVSIGAPTIRNNSSGFLYAELPDKNIASVNLSGSNLSISSQIVKNVSSNSLTFSISDFTGITSSFLQTFDEERYSIHYSDGAIEPLTSDKFSLSGNTVTVRNLTKSTDNNSVINASLIKNGINTKKKEYNRSRIVNITRSKYAQSGSNGNSSVNDGLTYNKFYGLRVQDEEVCLNYPDVSKVLAIYESFDTNAPVLDQIEFSSSANVSTNAIIGENILGNSSKAVARVVKKSISNPNILEIVYLNENKLSSGESVLFEESNINTDIVSITEGKYKNLTPSYKLDKGQKEQYYDYSRIIRNDNNIEPSKQLLVVFDHYTVPTSDSGDVFTVLSYDEQRFLSDIPSIESKDVRCSDTLDFRPRVPVFSSTDKSPFDFDSRTFTNDPRIILSPNESSLIGYDYYLARIDKLYVNKFGVLLLQKGVSAKSPKPPTKNDDVMEIATITLQPYLYRPSDAKITLVDNRRYTMRDIGSIENRVGNLERVTSLTLLESSTASLQIQDAQGRDRFKTGFFVDDFKNYSLINMDVSRIQISQSGSSIGGNELRPIISRNTLKSQLAPASSTTDETLDLSANFELLDLNVQKTGKVVTLKYKSVDWIEQPFATTQENVNPFHILEYIGSIKLTPEEDRWVRTVQLADRQVSVSVNLKLDLGIANLQDVNTTGESTGSGSLVRYETEVFDRSNVVKNSSSSTNATSERIFLGSSADQYMRSRNTEFSVSSLKAKTQFYHFLDGNSAVDFLPKLLEIANDSTLQNYGSSKQFSVGETVIGTYGGQDLITFRVASGDHKYGQFNSPSKTYQINPYFPDEKLSSTYSSSSKVLNIDTYSLCEEAQGKYYGYVVKGMRLVGQTSGAVAYVKDLRLITDNYGDLIGTFFLKDPNTNPAPTVRINTGKKTFKLNSSATNEAPLPGNKDLSSAEALYTSEGTIETFENVVTTTTTNVETTQTQVWKEYVTHARYYDPLAQTFAVGGKIEAPSAINTNDDSNGAFVTAVDLYFATKDSGNNPVRVEIRTVEFGTPTRSVLGTPAVLRPEDISISNNGEVATHVVFPSPIYLAPGKQYAIVVIADTSDKYYLWTAVMKEKTVNTASLPAADQVRYTQQFSLGRLYKSQNGAEWTPSDDQDLKFKLYKAEFTSNTGTAFFYNPTLDESNGYVQRLNNNPLTTLPKTTTIGITTSYILSSILTPGRKIGEDTITYRYGTIVGTGSSVSSVGLTTGGKNYVDSSNAQTFNITGKGSGLVLNISTSNGVITGTPTIVSTGHGYAVGDVVGIVTSSVGVSTATGADARITITGNSSSIDTLYLTGVQAEDFTKTGSSNLVYYSDSGTRVSLANTYITSSSVTPQTSPTDTNSGNFLKVDHFDHGMYSNTNQLTLKNVQSGISPVVLTSELLAENITSISIGAGDTTNFATFEGISVSPTNPGYVKINNEIIGYSNVSASGILTIISGGRGIDSTIVSTHPINSLVYKYELNGISLRRINKTHDISDLNIGLDGYYLEIDTSANGNGINRSTDGSFAGAPQLSFMSNQTIGGSGVLATENIQFNALVPTYDILTPGSATSVDAKIRSVSGTSIGGNETSFLDKGFEPVQLGQLNNLNSTRIVCSKINESIKLTNLPRNKSFTTGITFKTTDKNLSPVLFTDIAFTEFYSNRIDKPISDYASDDRVNSLLYDPHSAAYVSNIISLNNPAKCLKIILSAYCHESSDFRVLYSLNRADSSEISQSFELFPGYDNLTYNTNDQYVPIDLSKNSGRPDRKVPSSLNGEFREYEFTADNLDLFIGYRIKIVMSGTNQAYVPRIKQLRTLAVR